MRTIKFRAWNEKDSNPNARMIHPATLTYNGKVIMPDGEEWNIPVMQFTGLLDKNGKEIYEGDIVRYKVLSGFDCGWDDESFDRNSSEVKEANGKVSFINGEFSPREEANLVEDGYYSWRTFDFEVIGNIYENPELISSQ